MGFGTIFGFDYGTPSDPSLVGTLDAGGCLSLTEPFEIAFRLPGSGAVCGAAQEVSVALSIDKDITIVEGDPAPGSGGEDYQANPPASFTGSVAIGLTR